MGHMFYIGLYRENHEKILSETIWLKPGTAVVECLTRDREAAGSSLTGVTALWSFKQDTFILAQYWFIQGRPVPV